MESFEFFSTLLTLRFTFQDLIENATGELVFNWKQFFFFRDKVRRRKCLVLPHAKYGPAKRQISSFYSFGGRYSNLENFMYVRYDTKIYITSPAPAPSHSSLVYQCRFRIADYHSQDQQETPLSYSVKL